MVTRNTQSPHQTEARRVESQAGMVTIEVPPSDINCEPRTVGCGLLGTYEYGNLTGNHASGEGGNSPPPPPPGS